MKNYEEAYINAESELLDANSKLFAAKLDEVPLPITTQKFTQEPPKTDMEIIAVKFEAQMRIDKLEAKVRDANQQVVSLGAKFMDASLEAIQKTHSSFNPASLTKSAHLDSVVKTTPNGAKKQNILSNTPEISKEIAKSMIQKSKEVVAKQNIKQDFAQKLALNTNSNSLRSSRDR